MTKLTKQHQQVIKTLKGLAANWPADVYLFAAASSLLLVDKATQQVLCEFMGIPCDGGDPGSIFVGDDEFLDL